MGKANTRWRGKRRACKMEGKAKYVQGGLQFQLALGALLALLCSWGSGGAGRPHRCYSPLSTLQCGSLAGEQTIRNRHFVQAIIS